MGSTVVVAIDGPSGSGKSSTSRGVAKSLGLRYLDTGAQYRAMTAWLLAHEVDIADPEAVSRRCGEPTIESGTDPDAPTIRVDGVDVAQTIRSTQVTAAVSAVASVPQVRARVVALQRELISGGGIVVEGRDIGSVVAPEAEVKIYLTADAAARAERRTAEQGGGSVDVTQEALHRRDRIDSSRTTSPLRVADGAVHLDSTGHTLDEVVALVVALVQRASARS